MDSAPEPTSVRLPRSTLTTLSHRCARLGADGVELLREAGYRAGSELSASLSGTPGELPAEAFWDRLSDLLREAGLGAVRYEPVSGRLGALAWTGSAEAAGSHASRTASRCHLATGLLAGILSRTAGRTVDVVEISCGSGGATPCWFVFGSIEAVRAVRARVGALGDTSPVPAAAGSPRAPGPGRTDEG